MAGDLLPDGGLAEYCKRTGVKNVVVLSGEDISLSADPDFRSSGPGQIDNLQKYNIPNPEAIFNINYFRRDPQPFNTLASEIYPGNFSPTTSHSFVRLLAENGILLITSTPSNASPALTPISSSRCTAALQQPTHCIGPQVTDSIESETSTHDRSPPLAAKRDQRWKFASGGCGRTYPISWMQPYVDAATVPRCESCSGLVKPDIIFSRERLPERFCELAYYKDFVKCDFLIVIGTSLAVRPFAYLIDHPADEVPRLLINPEIVGVQGSPTQGFNFAAMSRGCAGMLRLRAGAMRGS
ncbi:DHS-like NAD/FAD-binding domain-containing protein [Blyttiomyces helicus]|uniref:DHS-like NAD/FAD-binding domain-containing protein n=1 Tax=Blyttiomyces helicus TaxID=388810 RepID=A0A4V1IQ54_9FUNG|nr:DHS-like NAD/FAD-binding domain-containing protein [Blyttiomyces helicus]|eukprot:RKO85367.1 DHS-like NAD/FAD-binding domain-containing protein [Blyttiomyces helicus]